MGLMDGNVLFELRAHQKRLQELVEEQKATNQWLAHIAQLLERQAPMQGGVWQQAGGAQR